MSQPDIRPILSATEIRGSAVVTTTSPAAAGVTARQRKQAMARQTTTHLVSSQNRKASVTSVDPVWERLRSEAEAMLADDPGFRPVTGRLTG